MEQIAFSQTRHVNDRSSQTIVPFMTALPDFGPDARTLFQLCPQFGNLRSQLLIYRQVRSPLFSAPQPVFI